MQALLDSFIQEIDTIDDVDELRRRLIALKKEQLELLNRESEHLRAQSETALLFQQAQDEAKGLRRENEEMWKTACRETGGGPQQAPAAYRV